MSRTPDFPDKKYDVIYADPPWDYGDAPSKIGEGGNFVIPYPMMSTADICALPVHDIASDNCLAFIWTTGLFLQDTFKVGKAWGFTYSTIAFNWDKELPIIGCYNMIQTELCLLFKRGKRPPQESRKERQMIRCRKGSHSVKPLEAKCRIDRMFPTQSKIELFARPLPLLSSQDDGWDYWGNEV